LSADLCAEEHDQNFQAWYKKIMKKEDLESRDRSDILRVDNFGNMLRCRLIWQSGDMSTTMSVLVLSTRASA
jgi:hypothetical protein